MYAEAQFVFPARTLEDVTDKTPEDAAGKIIEDAGPWDPPLADPNSKGWFPRQHKRQTLKQAFYERCL